MNYHKAWKETETVEESPFGLCLMRWDRGCSSKQASEIELNQNHVTPKTVDQPTNI